MAWASFLVIFLTNSSGHPASKGKQTAATKL
jgi:hypothetical protein